MVNQLGVVEQNDYKQAYYLVMSIWLEPDLTKEGVKILYRIMQYLETKF